MDNNNVIKRITKQLNVGFSNSVVSEISKVGFSNFFKQSFNVDFQKNLNLQGKFRLWQIFKDYNFGAIGVTYNPTTQFEKFKEVTDEYFPDLTNSLVVRNQLRTMIGTGRITDAFDDYFVGRFLASLSRIEIMRFIMSISLDNPTIKFSHLNFRDKTLLKEILKHLKETDKGGAKAISIVAGMKLQDIFFSREALDLMQQVKSEETVALLKDIDPFQVELINLVTNVEELEEDFFESKHLKILDEFLVSMGEDRINSYSEEELQSSVNALVEELNKPFNKRHKMSPELKSFIYELGLTV
jgi:hypothetical protein